MNSTPSEQETKRNGDGASWYERWLSKGLRPLRVCDYVYEVPLPDKAYTPEYRATLPEDELWATVVRKRRWALMSIAPPCEQVDKTFTVQHRDWLSARAGMEGLWERTIGPWGAGLIYRRSEVMRAVQAGEDVLLLEGEKDCDSAVEAGWGAVTTHYQGSGGWRPDQAEVFRGFRGRVRIVMDNDVIGVQLGWANAKTLRASGFEGKIRFYLPAIRDFKSDVTDHIRAGFGREDLVPQSHRQMKELIDKLGPLPRGNGSYSYETRELGEAIGPRGKNWKTRRVAS